MSKYSEVVGSFLRVGDFPMEADYIFKTEKDLIDFYSDPVNASVLHKGLFKIVENGDNGKQSLYWITQEGNELKFVKLIADLDIQTIYNQLENKFTDLSNFWETIQ